MPARFIQQSAIFIPQTRLNSSLCLGECRSNWLWLLQWLNNNTTPHWRLLQPASSPAVASLASMLRTVQSNRDSDSGHRRGTLCSPCPRWRCPAWARQWKGQSYVSQSHAHTHTHGQVGEEEDVLGGIGMLWNSSLPVHWLVPTRDTPTRGNTSYVTSRLPFVENINCTHWTCSLLLHLHLFRQEC